MQPAGSGTNAPRLLAARIDTGSGGKHPGETLNGPTRGYLIFSAADSSGTTGLAVATILRIPVTINLSLAGVGVS